MAKNLLVVDGQGGQLGSQIIKVIEKNDGVNIYEAGQQVNAVLNPRDVMSYVPGEDGEDNA
mgnify:FL=1